MFYERTYKTAKANITTAHPYPDLKRSLTSDESPHLKRYLIAPQIILALKKIGPIIKAKHICLS